MKQVINISISAATFLFALGIATATGLDIVMQAVILAFCIQWVLFIPAYVFQTEKFYDLSGSITYVTVIWFAMLSSDNYENTLNIGNMIIAIFITMWALRLGSFLFMRIKKDGEDKRFRSIKPSSTQFFMTWTLQGLWVSLCSMCALTAIASPDGIIMNTIFYIGVLFFLLGFGIEVVADNQKSKFRANAENKNKFITSGLWSKSRHPNYFGEILLWLGIAVMSISSLSGLQYLTLISPIFTYLLLVYVSGVRMLETMSDKKWGHEDEYVKYKKDTPTLFFKVMK